MAEREAACKPVKKWMRTGMERKMDSGKPARVAALGDIGPGTDEAVLLTAARMGHPTAFGYLVERHAGRIRRIALRITRNREDAEDAAQECFKSAFTHFESFRGESRFSTWLTRIALNAALMKIRARRRDLVPLYDSLESLVSVKYHHGLRSRLSPEESYSRGELQSILADETVRLRPRLRGPVVLCYMEGLIARDAAKVLGISNSAIKARLRRARLTLRSRLEHLGVGKNASESDRRVGSDLFCRDPEPPRWFAPTVQTPDFGD
jgi:RNA polymerase sigma-70 factor, ECF subfamily